MKSLDDLHSRGYLVPLAIVLAALILGVALFLTLRKTPEQSCLEGGGNWSEIGEEFICIHPRAFPAGWNSGGWPSP